MPHENSRRYLNAFSEIERALRCLIGATKGMPFYNLIRKCSQREAIVKKYADDLREFADLRNAIVHERCNGEPIAEPHHKTVLQIEKIRNHIIAPPTVEPVFFRKVICCDLNDPIDEVAKTMLKGSFSQIPMYERGKCKGLLTAETVARWLADKFQDNISVLKGETVGMVADFREYWDNYRFISRKTTLFEVLDHFDSFAKIGKKLDALIITSGGKSNEKPLGIVTVFDLPKTYRLIG